MQKEIKKKSVDPEAIWATSWENLFLPYMQTTRVQIYLASVAAQADLSLPWSKTP